MRDSPRPHPGAPGPRTPLAGALPALTAALALFATAAGAEGYSASRYTHRPMLLQVGWEYALPLGQLRSSFLDTGTPAGIEGELRATLTTQLSAGVALSWKRFQQTHASGDPARLAAFAARGTLHYYLTRTSFQPYLGIGIGGLYREAVLGGRPTQTGFGFCADPQVGMLITLDQGFALNLVVRYELTTASLDVSGQPYPPVRYPQWLGFQVGLAFY